jgi:bifunctional DNase/RNase
MVELELQGVVMPEEHKYPVVLLRHEMKVLPILVGPAEADAIQRGLLGEKTARPMTHDLLKNILAGLRAELKSVTIYRLENDTFYAHLNVEQRSAQGQLEQVLRIDTRPSDGIAHRCPRRLPHPRH